MELPIWEMPPYGCYQSLGFIWCQQLTAVGCVFLWESWHLWSLPISSSSTASQVEWEITGKVPGYWPCQLWLSAGHSSLLLFTVALEVWTDEPGGSYLAWRSYKFTSHLCEPYVRMGNSSCSPKNHFNSWHVHLPLFKVEKYRTKSIWYSLRMRVTVARSAGWSPRSSTGENGSTLFMLSGLKHFPNSSATTVWNGLLQGCRDTLVMQVICKFTCFI